MMRHNVIQSIQYGSLKNGDKTDENRSLAQQESQSLSQNVRLGLQYRYQQGKVQVCTNRFLGYDKDEEGKLIINPEEAETVRRIFREYLEGRSYYDIGKGLTAEGIKTAAGSDFWLASTLRKILRNEKYIWDALRQKIVEMETVLVGINGKVEEYEDALVRKLIERIMVYDDYFTVEFKSGIEIDVSLPYVNRITRGREQLVNKTFLKMMDELGYDVELTYKKGS